MVAVALVVVPTLADPGNVHQFRGVVALDQLGVFPADLKGVGDPCQEGIEGLAVKVVEATAFS